MPRQSAPERVFEDASSPCAEGRSSLRPRALHHGAKGTSIAPTTLAPLGAREAAGPRTLDQAFRARAGTRPVNGSWSRWRRPSRRCSAGCHEVSRDPSGVRGVRSRRRGRGSLGDRARGGPGGKRGDRFESGLDPRTNVRATRAALEAPDVSEAWPGSLRMGPRPSRGAGRSRSRDSTDEGPVGWPRAPSVRCSRFSPLVPRTGPAFDPANDIEVASKRRAVEDAWPPAGRFRG